MARHFLKTEPFYYSQKYALKYECDLAIPSWAALGTMVVYTRLIEAIALRLGRTLKILTAPHFYTEESIAINECYYPILDENPYIKEIVNADLIDLKIMRHVSSEMDNFPQLGHITENICAPWGLKPRKLHGDLYLTKAEKQKAIETLSHLPRPVVALCPYGNSSPLQQSDWYEKKWLKLIETLERHVSFFQVGHDKFHHKSLPLFTPKHTTVREMMALIWACDVYVGFDTGPSHIAAAFEKPTMVIWDAVRKAKLEEAKEKGYALATLGRWTYPHTKNITLIGERENEGVDWIVDFIVTECVKLSREHSVGDFVVNKDILTI